MEVIFLGTGTSQGVPMIACTCDVCRSRDRRDWRTRTSVHVVMDGLHVQVDAAPEFRQQCVSNGVAQIDVFILTHGHADHIAGMDDLRRFCEFEGGEALSVWTTGEGATRIRQMFPYAICERPQAAGYPAFQPKIMPEMMEFPQGTIQSTLLTHGSIQVLGLVFQERSSGAKLTYYTDCKTVSDEQRELARGSWVAVLDGLRHEKHPTHMCITEAIAVAKDIGAEETYLTHLAHAVSHGRDERKLPLGMKFAYDGLRLKIG